VKTISLQETKKLPTPGEPPLVQIPQCRAEESRPPIQKYIEFMHQKETEASEGGNPQIEEEEKTSWGAKEVKSEKYVEVMFPEQKT
jgi:hypothetical protein